MRLMVSVVSVHEAREAAHSGPVLLDVKNPEEGSLGASVPKVIRQISEILPPEIELSAAIGDMPNLPGTAALAALGAAICGARYIKVGLYRQHSVAEAVALMCAVREAVAGIGAAVIAGGYADYHRVGALDPRCLPDVAEEASIQGFLVDTAIKDGHSLFDHFGTEQLTALSRRAHEKGLLFAAAGALQEEHLPLLMQSGADIAGVRTAVCRNNDRKGPLDQVRLRNLIEKFGRG